MVEVRCGHGVYVEGQRYVSHLVQALTLDKWRRDTESQVEHFLKTNCTEILLPPTGGLINCRNGMLNPRTGEVHRHAPSYKSIMQVNAEWDPNADTQEVDSFVAAVLP